LNSTINYQSYFNCEIRCFFNAPPQYFNFQVEVEVGAVEEAGRLLLGVDGLGK
jgi:hypothetical protein